MQAWFVDKMGLRRGEAGVKNCLCGGKKTDQFHSLITNFQTSYKILWIFAFVTANEGCKQR